MTRVFSLIFILFNCYYGVIAQNLMTNGGFEEYDECPRNYTTQSKTILIPGWHIPTSGTSDYFNRCDLSRVVGVPRNSMGELETFEGNGYAGIIISGNPSPNSETKNYREYLQNKLTQPLDSGAIYCFKIYYAISSYSRYSTNRLGAFFSTEKITSKNKILKKQPHISIDSLRPTAKKDQWYELCGTYIAEGGEKFVTIGNYFNDKQTQLKQFYASTDDLKSKRVGGNNKYAYYFIDNTSLIKVDDASYCCGNNLIEKRGRFPSELNIKVGKTYILENIYFDFDRYKITTKSEPTLDLLTQQLLENKNWTIQLAGHTDSLGTQKYNQQLSLLRAKAVKTYLNNNGIEEDRITFSGFGELKPINTNHGKGADSENRRVEFKINTRSFIPPKISLSSNKK